MRQKVDDNQKESSLLSESLVIIASKSKTGTQMSPHWPQVLVIAR